MKVKIKRNDTTLPLPIYHTKGAVGFDFYCRKDLIIPAHDLGKIPLNYCIETPEGYMLMVCSRGSTAFKKGLMPAHGVGIGDWDFRGDSNEYVFPVYNFTDSPVTVKRGERIAQGIFIKIDRAIWDEVGSMQSGDRGSFGSTGGYGEK